MTEKNETILITGGMGYIGGRLATFLADNCRNRNIKILTRQHGGSLPIWCRNFDVVQGDVLDEQSLENAVKNVDTIIHLAAINEIEASKNPKLALDVNGWGTYNILNVAQKNNIKRFIYFSTFHVYGLNTVDVINESTATRPITSYAISHLIAEGFVDHFRQYYQMETLIFRLSNPYGNPMHPEVNRWTLVFNDLCLQAVKKKKITLKSSGKQYRDFISLNDVGRAVDYMLNQPYNMWEDGLFNLGGDCSMMIIQVAKKIQRLYMEVYGIEIPIEIPPDNKLDSIKKPIKYGTKKLHDIGFIPNSFNDEEIKKTFKFAELYNLS